ncbi:MAG: DUF4062 domain-containing protein, partial [Candidatus Aminicenantales bacterium]
MSKTDSSPKVFLSSTIKDRAPDDPGLEPHRERIKELIEGKFGWNCLLSEGTGKGFWGSNVSACLNSVASADLFIGIFWKRYGMVIPDSGLPLTEMEFYTALNKKKPMRLFVIESSQREPALQEFLDCLRHEHFVIFCDVGDLLPRVEKALEDFGSRWPSESLLSPLVPPLYIDQILTKLDLLPYELCIFRTEPRYNVFDRDLVSLKLDHMKILHELYAYEEVIGEGWDILNMLRFRPPESYPEFRGFWISFLTMWEDACNWYGYIQGSLGSLWAARALREIYRLSEAWYLFNSSASVIASNLYALATSIEAKAAHETIRTWEPALLNMAREYLLRSLDYVNISFYRESALSVSACSIRGNICRKLGNYQEAIRSHRMALERCTSDEGRGMQISHIGRAKILQNDKEGLSDLEEAVAICQNLRSPSKVRTLKALGQGFIELKEYDRAEETCNKA